MLQWIRTWLTVRLAWWVAAAWLLAGIPATGLLRPNPQDFSQFYVTGLVAREGAWDDLYPIPLPHSRHNPGVPEDSLMRPAYARLAREHGEPEPYRFIQSPPNALWCWPLAFLEYRTANVLWFVLNGAAVLLLIRHTLLLYRIAGGASPAAQTSLILVIALSPMTYRAIRVGNVSPLVALACSTTLLSLVRTSPVRGGVALFWGTLAKYAPAVLLPLLILRRRWRELATAALLGGLAFAAAWLIMGGAPLDTFRRSIAPTLALPFFHRGNQSLVGFAGRLAGGELAGSAAVAVRLVQWMTGLLLLFWLAWRRRQLEEPIRCLAAGGALLAWLLVVSPIAWEHYALYLFPLWGLLLATGALRWALYAAIALAWFPLNVLDGIRNGAPEFIGSHLLWSHLLILLLCLRQSLAATPQVLVATPSAPAR